ncbi:MAG: DUF6263 family protein [Candidatus Kapaibacterium sp.]
MKKLFVVVLLIAVNAMAYAKEYSPKLNLEKGKAYFLHVQAVADIEQELFGQTIEMENFTEEFSQYIVNEITDSSYVIEAEYKYMGIGITTAQMDMQFKSNKKDSVGFMDKAMANMCDVPFTIHLHKDGHVIEVTGYERVMNGFMSALDEAPAQVKAMSESLSEQISGESKIKEFIETFTLAMPRQPVDIGEKWSRMATNATLKTDYENNFTLMNANDNIYNIAGHSKFRTDTTNVIEINGMPITYDMDVVTDIDMQIDRNTGWAVDIDFEQTMDGNLSVKTGPGETMESKMKSVNRTRIWNDFDY